MDQQQKLAVVQNIAIADNAEQVFNPNAGQSSFSFTLTSSANAILDLNSIRLIGQLRLVGNLNKHSERPNYKNSSFLSEDSGATIISQSNSSSYMMDERIGQHSAIAQITISDLQGNTLEQAVMVPHTVCQSQPLNSSLQDYSSYLQCESGAFAREKTQALISNAPQMVSLRPECGMLKSSPIPFTQFGSLKIEIQMSTASNAIFSIEGHSLDAANATASFELKNTKLAYRTIMAPNQISPMPKQYIHHQNLTQNITSSVTSNSFNLNASRVSSAVISYVPSIFFNNYAHNAFATYKLRNKSGNDFPKSERVEIKENQFFRNQVPQPTQQPIDERNITFQQNLPTGVSQSFDSMRMLFTLIANQGYNEINRLLASAATENLGNFDEIKCASSDKPVYTVARSYMLSSPSPGGNFETGNNLSTMIESGLDGVSNNTAIYTIKSTRLMVPQKTGGSIIVT